MASSCPCMQKHDLGPLPCHVFRNLAFLLGVYHCNFVGILSFLSFFVFKSSLLIPIQTIPHICPETLRRSGWVVSRTGCTLNQAGANQLVACCQGNSRKVNNEMVLVPFIPQQVCLWSWVNLREVSTMVGSHLFQGGGGVKIESNAKVLASQIISTHRLFGSGLVPTVFSESLFNGPAYEKIQQEIKERNLLMAFF